MPSQLPLPLPRATSDVGGAVWRCPALLTVAASVAVADLGCTGGTVRSWALGAVFPCPQLFRISDVLPPPSTTGRCAEDEEVDRSGERDSIGASGGGN